MIETPFFSVVIPTFNRAELIGKAIKSVLEQSFRDFELIIADDCSNSSGINNLANTMETTNPII